MPRTKADRPPFHWLILKIVAVVFAGLFFLLLTTWPNSAQRQKERPRQIKCVVCVEPTPTPTPAPTPNPSAVYEQATNCVKVFGIDPSTDKDQSLVRCTIRRGAHFKVKASGKISSSTTREGDFAGFEVAETVRSSIDETKSCFQRGRSIIEKSSPVFGVVLKRKHRHFPMVNGKLNVSLGAVAASDGTEIPVFIDRSRCPECLECLLKTNTQCRQFCAWRSTDPRSRQPNSLCDKPEYVSGRADRNVSVVVQALAATALAFINKRDNPTEKAFILFTLASQSGIADLLNGTDAEIQAGEIFDAYVTRDTDVVLSVSKAVFITRSPAKDDCKD